MKDYLRCPECDNIMGEWNEDGSVKIATQRRIYHVPKIASAKCERCAHEWEPVRLTVRRSAPLALGLALTPA